MTNLQLTPQERYELWTSDPYFDPAMQAELRALLAFPKEIAERFNGWPTFGTGGMRGQLGAGESRINAVTVALATRGLARTIRSRPAGARPRGVVIAFDTRLQGAWLAEIAAACLISQDIPVFFSETCRPVPILSFAVRHLQADAGIMITASHNPAQYNGYKVYGADGGQITLDTAGQIMQAMQSVSDPRTMGRVDPAAARRSPLWQVLPESVDAAYLDYLSKTQIRPENLQSTDLNVVYTPLHGTGALYVEKILRAAGISQIRTVQEQAIPDPFFSTVSMPNPESPEAFAKAVSLAESVQADLAVATDPDSDRVGVFARAASGQYQALSGNQIGLLLMEYILRSRHDLRQLPDDAFCVTTRVSTRLAERVAETYQTELQETLTGFKYIGERIQWFDEEAGQTFCFGFEESFGYLAGTLVRDKDALQALLLICELAAEAKAKGQSLIDRLDSLYQRYGYAAEKTVSIEFSGLDGLQEQRSVMTALRQRLTTGEASLIGGQTARSWQDYQKPNEPEYHNGAHNPRYLPPADMLYWEMGGELGLDWICIRPSGTEPKLKIYLGAYAGDPARAADHLAHLLDGMTELILSCR